MVPRWTMMNPTTTPARASSDELASRSSGKTLVRNPIRKMIEATNSEESRDFVLFATRSLTVQTSMTTTNATTGFMQSLRLSHVKDQTSGMYRTAMARNSAISGRPSFQ